jgi:leader peptidase (prepilin peptidase)/N-methyltransferase
MNDMVISGYGVWGLMGVLGLVVGSFLGVVVYRLPKMLVEENTLKNGQSFNLAWPGSHCPLCESPLRWWHKLPLLGFILQRGHCHQCGGSIAWRYPLLELGCAALWIFCGVHAGFLPLEGAGSVTAWSNALVWAVFSSALLALAWIDWETLYLPSDLTQPLLWGGLLAAEGHLTGLGLSQALWGAVLGYSVLWIVATGFALITGKEGMGAGDFKLLAALGAWLGPLNLLPLLLFASTCGAGVGLWLRARSQLREGGYVPFGPFLAAAGWLIYALDPQGMQRVFWGVLGV